MKEKWKSWTPKRNVFFFGIASYGVNVMHLWGYFLVLSNSQTKIFLLNIDFKFYWLLEFEKNSSNRNLKIQKAKHVINHKSDLISTWPCNDHQQICEGVSIDLKFSVSKLAPKYVTKIFADTVIFIFANLSYGWDF